MEALTKLWKHIVTSDCSAGTTPRSERNFLFPEGSWSLYSPARRGMKTCLPHPKRWWMFYLCTKKAASKWQIHEAILKFPHRTNFPWKAVKMELQFQCLLLVCIREEHTRYLQFWWTACRAKDDRPSVLAGFGHVCNLFAFPRYFPAPCSY